MIHLEEIISSVQSGSKKIRPTLVMNLEKPITYSVPRDEKAHDFISSVQKRA
jgi:TFIIF-interacting CTD phosphatase-like protein